MRMTTRRLFLPCLALLGLTACQDVGLPDRNLPLEDAKHRAPAALVAAVHGTGTDSLMAREATEQPVAREGELGAERKRPVAIAGRAYIVSGRAHEVPRDMLRPVGSYQGRPLYALSWDQQPFDRLYTPAEQPNEFWELQIAPDVGPARHPKAEPTGAH